MNDTTSVVDGSNHPRGSDYLRAVQDENVAELHSLQAEGPTYLHLRYVSLSGRRQSIPACPAHFTSHPPSSALT
jgi:hypothetical protein